MQIILCEDDSMFHGGVPTLVVIMVTFDNGKTKRLPYPADRTISALYEDLKAIADQVHDGSVVTPQEDIDPFKDSHRVSVKPTLKNKPSIPKVDKSNVIEKEDFVTLVRLDEGRSKDASCDLVLGGEYRVIKVYQTGITKPGDNHITHIANGYDVVDDSSPRPERTRVFPHEVTLVRKRNPPLEKEVGKFEEILHCPLCDAMNACVLEGDRFKAICESCQNDIDIQRIIKPCPSEKCKNDVSLFDVGDKFKGVCNKCKSVAEVEYA